MKINIGSEVFEIPNTSWLNKEEIEKEVVAILLSKKLKDKQEVVLVSQTSREHFFFGVQETYYFCNSGLGKKWQTLF